MPKIPQNHTFTMYNTHKTEESNKLQNCSLCIIMHVFFKNTEEHRLNIEYHSIYGTSKQ